MQAVVILTRCPCAGARGRRAVAHPGGAQEEAAGRPQGGQRATSQGRLGEGRHDTQHQRQIVDR